MLQFTKTPDEFFPHPITERQEVVLTEPQVPPDPVTARSCDLVRDPAGGYDVRPCDGEALRPGEWLVYDTSQCPELSKWGF